MEEKIIKIMYLLLLVILSIVSIVSTICTVRAKKQNGEDVTASNVMDILYDNMLSYLPKAEKVYNAYKGVANANTSEMKLNDVLNKIRCDCLALDVVFDEHYWTDEIKAIIDVTKQVNIK